MKRLCLFTVLIFISSLMFSSNSTYAGDKEWATVGKILTGVVGGGIVHNIFSGSGYYPAYYPSGRYYYGYDCYAPAGVSIHFDSGGYRYYPRGYYRYPRHYYRPYHHRRPYYARRHHYNR